MPNSASLSLARFEADITPPIGTALCGCFYPPVVGVTAPLHALGVVLYPAGQQPIVLCALDWAELSNESHLEWRTKLAEAVGTIPDRVTVNCTHTHHAPWPDTGANRLLTEAGALPLMDVEWSASVLKNVCQAAAQAPRIEIGEVRIGQAEVKGIASNRRVMNEDGTKVKLVRWTCSASNPEALAAPEGLIDPYLRTIQFHGPTGPVAALHFYTTHPASWAEPGFVTPEFCGLAREKLRAEQPGVLHLYFTGCAGNITGGKYNTGDEAGLHRFTDLTAEAMRASIKSGRKIDFSRIHWKSTPVVLPPTPEDTEKALTEKMRDSSVEQGERSRCALRLAYRQRLATPIILGYLEFSPEAALLFLPSEAFVEYQLFAQELRGGSWTAVAAYGDCGPGYITLARSFEEGGYEPQDSFVGPGAEEALRSGIKILLKS